MAIVGIVRGGEREAVKCLCLLSVTTGPQLPEHFTLLQNWRRPLLGACAGTRGDGDRDEVQLAVRPSSGNFYLEHHLMVSWRYEAAINNCTDASALNDDNFIKVKTYTASVNME